jgi:hypothetical protein
VPLREWLHTLEWMRLARPRLDRNQWRTGWPVIRRLQREWSDQRRRLAWESPLGPVTMAGWAIRPLTTGQAMIDEGRRMRHCVADYIDDCHQGRYRVFTAEHSNTGEPAATIGLRLVEGQWQLVQVRGQRNHAVGEGLERVAREVMGRHRGAVRV